MMEREIKEARRNIHIKLYRKENLILALSKESERDT
jgi:predicted HTH domain antitoxin